MDRVLACLRAAAEPTRLRLLALCAASDMNVSDLTGILGQSQPRVSRHLKLLCDAGLLDRHREGSWVFYRLADDSSEEGRIARQLISLLPTEDQQTGQDHERLDEIKAQRALAAADYFRANAEEWDSVRSLHVQESDVESALLGCFPDHLEDLLDIGTGTGRMLQLFAGRVDRGVGLDTSRDMLAVARANLETMGIHNCHVRHGDMYRLSLEDEAFDGVIVHQVLHYSENPARVVSEAARVLRPGGILVVADFSPHNLETLREDHAHLRLGFDDAEIGDWFAKAGLAVGPISKLEGDPLTVTLWSATRSPIHHYNDVQKTREQEI
jgi:ubiquinone/menaquinone biosynthesis C-methylase UbiE